MAKKIIGCNRVPCGDEPEPTDEELDHLPGAFMCDCGEGMEPDNLSPAEMEVIGAFVREHQRHGNVYICYEDEDGNWVSRDQVTIFDG